MYHLVEQLCMLKAYFVLAKTLSMVSSEDDDRIIVYTQLLQSLYQSFQMMIILFQLLIISVDHVLHQAGMQLLNDAVMEEPTVPLDEGTLRGSGSVFVQDQLVGTSRDLGANGTPATEHSEGNKRELVAVVGFNTPYAAYQHEGVRADGTHVVENYSEAGSGRKFLETPLKNHRKEYMGIVAERIRQSG